MVKIKEHLPLLAFTKKIAGEEFISSLAYKLVVASALRHEMHSFEEQKLMDIDCYSMESITG